MYKRKLKENIETYKNSNPVRLHMPGHNGKGKESYYGDDVTELSFSDNLLHPENVLLNLEEDIKNIYDSKHSFILINGSSSGIIASILYSLRENDKILLPRNSHISNYYGVYLSKGNPIYIYPKDINVGLKEEEYIKVLNENKDIKAVVITYPSYYGYIVDIKSLCNKIRSINEDIIIIVDEAHGGHLTFADDNYPISALKADNDIVITSTHKTIGALTQTSLMHINSDKINKDKLFLYLKMMMSTSPSYILLTSVEEAIYNAKEHGKELLEAIRKLYLYSKTEIEKNTSFSYEEFGLKNHDYTKICINTKNSNINGYDLYKELETKYNIYTEFANETYVLAYLGLGTNKSDILSLIYALKEIDLNIKKRKKIKVENYLYEKIPKNKYPIYKALNKNSKKVLIKDSLMGISYNFIIPYPPGFPVLVPGEVIDEDMVNYLLEIYEKQDILGIDKGYIEIIKE